MVKSPTLARDSMLNRCHHWSSLAPSKNPHHPNRSLTVTESLRCTR